MTRSALDDVTVATPCSLRWEDLSGDGTRRFCDHCRRHVHNLSALSRPAAEALLAERGAAGQRLCATYLVRPDGSLVTAEEAAPRPRLARLRAAAALAAGLFGLLPFFASCRETAPAVVAPDGEHGTSPDDVAPACGSAPVDGEDVRMLMGEVTLPEPVELRVMGRIAAEPPRDAEAPGLPDAGESGS
jgi:hypothetical protein